MARVEGRGGGDIAHAEERALSASRTVADSVSQCTDRPRSARSGTSLADSAVSSARSRLSARAKSLARKASLLIGGYGWDARRFRSVDTMSNECALSAAEYRRDMIMRSKRPVML